MKFSPESSASSDNHDDANGCIESLAGYFHPHRIEVQEFGEYELIVDARARADYEDDHIPGAVNLDPSDCGDINAQTVFEGALTTARMYDEAVIVDLPAALKVLAESVRPDQAILLYCGQGGQLSEHLARALRWRGWTVDVLPGGWINYRRWVEAGLEVLPRMLDFRALSAADPTDVGHVLTGLAELGCSVLSLDQLAATVRAGRGKVQQHRFESELLNVLRWLDPARPVWVSNSQTDLCNARIPLALVQAIDTAPLVSIRTGKASELELDKAGGLSMPPLALYDRTPLSIRDAVAQWLNLLPT